jgi:hypothetical protein
VRNVGVARHRNGPWRTAGRSQSWSTQKKSADGRRNADGRRSGDAKRNADAKRSADARKNVDAA